MKVPWRRIKYWKCDACGKCCSEYRIPLTFYEYLKLKNTGFVEEKSGRFFIRKINGKCPFQVGNLCTLQGELKPLACKLFPFSIRKKGKIEALYEYEGEEFYVYVDIGCKNVIFGKPSNIMRMMIEEAIEVYLGKRKDIDLITARLKQERQVHVRSPMVFSY